jgi:hypothetical protein
MSHQESLTVIADVGEGRVDALKRMLGTIREHVGDWHVMPFAKLPRVHFAQLCVLDATELDGRRLPARLGMLTTVDAPLSDHFDDLSTKCAEGMDAVFSHCTGYPAASERSPATRRKFLQDRSLKSDAVHMNRRGRTVQQIRQEEALRRELGAFLDAGDFSGRSCLDVRNQIIAFVRGRRDLDWALRLPDPPALSWRVKNVLHGVSYALLVIVLSPLLLAGLPVFLWLLRRHEKRDVPDTSAAPATTVQALRDDEDHWVHNPFLAAGSFKPGVFRKITASLILAVADYATRHIYNRGSLSGLNTIHFARWVRMDGGRRMLFASIYDGTVESYMNDFIDKAAWGVNAIFGNGDGFPTTVYMVGKGITDEKAYKRFLPTRLVHTSVWSRAYPQLTTKNIANNEAIRAGLSADMNEEQARLWLKRFGSGNQLPESRWAARMLDALPWDRICRNWN